MGKQRRIIQVLEQARIPSKFKLRVEAIDVRYIGELSGHGSGLYVRVPKEICDYYGLAAGDKVKVSILQRKKWTDLEEAEQ
jgi:predicted transcriptional regulator with HTH domain